MGFDPATMAAISATVGTAVGDQQLGGPAPAPGVQPAQPPSGLIGGSPGGGFGGLSGAPNPLEAAITPPASEQAGPPIEQAGPPSIVGNQEEKPGFLSSLFGSLDNTLQSPSKLLGIGLLNQLKPGAGNIGLGLSGLLGAFKQ